MPTKETHKDEGDSQISAMAEAVEAVFHNPDVLFMLLKSLLGSNTNSNNPRGKTPEEIALFEKEHLILKKQPLLAEAIFNGGVRDLIAIGRTTISELDSKPKELLDILRNGRMRGAVAEGAVTVKHLMGISPDKLKEADQLIHGNIDMRYEEGRNNYKKVTDLLGLDEKQAESLRASIDKTDQELDRQRGRGAPQMVPSRSVPSSHHR